MPEKQTPAYETASVATDVFETAQCELSQTCLLPTGLSSLALLRRAAGAQGIKVTLSGDFLFSYGGLIGSDEAVPSLAVKLEDGKVFPLTPNIEHPRIRHTLTGLLHSPRAIVIGGNIQQAAGQTSPAPPVMLHLSPATNPTAPLQATPLSFHKPFPPICGHSACNLSLSEVALFGGELHGTDSSALYVISEAGDGNWTWKLLTQVSLPTARKHAFVPTTSYHYCSFSSGNGFNVPDQTWYMASQQHLS